MSKKQTPGDSKSRATESPAGPRQSRNQSASRRKALKTALVGGTAVAAGTAPTKWVAPVVNSVVLPTHATTSGGGSSDNTGPWFGAIETVTEANNAPNGGSLLPVPGSMRDGFTAPDHRLLASANQSKASQDSAIERIAGSLGDALVPPAHAQAAVGYLCAERTGTADELRITLQIELGDGYTANYTGTGMESVVGQTPIDLTTSCEAANNRYAQVEGFFDSGSYVGFQYFLTLYEPDDDFQTYAGILPPGSCSILPENCEGIA